MMRVMRCGVAFALLQWLPTASQALPLCGPLGPLRHHPCRQPSLDARCDAMVERHGPRLLRCALKLNAGFGFRFGVLNGCLQAAQALNSTLVFENDAFYLPRKDMGIDPKTFDELLRLNAALPSTHLVKMCLEKSFYKSLATSATLDEGPLKRSAFSAWWPTHGPALEQELRDRETAAKQLWGKAFNATRTDFGLKERLSGALNRPQLRVYDLSAKTGSRRQGRAPLFSHDYSKTASWLREALVNATMLYNGTAKQLPLFPRASTTVAVHVRNGDRLPGRTYEKAMHLNLDDEWYINALKALIQCVSSQNPGASPNLHVALMGSSVAHAFKDHSTTLLDSHGNASRIPAFLQEQKVVYTVAIDHDTKSDLARFAFADVFVAARSQFSYAAMAMTRGVVLVPFSFEAHHHSRPKFDGAHSAKCHVVLHDDGNIDLGRLRGALRDCRNFEDFPGGHPMRRPS
ncbi:hypothetical protein M885DRAFT_588569 [Pelagophyceae sp. CCMP2097]|nr:hypothetical protein M885DRAFT_588569 [Pelagophyceae sp. CCMP2097]